MFVSDAGKEPYKALKPESNSIIGPDKTKGTSVLSADFAEIYTAKKSVPFGENSNKFPVNATDPFNRVADIRTFSGVNDPAAIAVNNRGNNPGNADNLKGKTMKFSISTKVDRNYEEVFDAFGKKELFLKVSPPYIKFNLLRFDGSKENDQIHMELLFPGSKQLWISKVTKVGKTGDELYFIDEGMKLPFFLKSWEHKHRVVKNENGAEIIDEINFKTPSVVLDYLLYPVLYKQFNYRKTAYQNYFNKK
jgi:ligand-binding SRPBCC domain-containing protein